MESEGILRIHRPNRPSSIPDIKNLKFTLVFGIPFQKIDGYLVLYISCQPKTSSSLPTNEEIDMTLAAEFKAWCGGTSEINQVILLMEDIPNKHLGCMKHVVNNGDKLPTSTG